MSKNVVDTVLDTVGDTVSGVEQEVDEVMEPVRKSLIKRFPLVFIVMVTFGVAATFFAFERILMEVTFLYTRPWLMLSIGLGVLLATGTLYKKLG